MMRIDVIGCVFVQISNLGKHLFHRFAQRNVLSKSCDRIFKSAVSPEQIDETFLFFALWV